MGLEHPTAKWARKILTTEIFEIKREKIRYDERRYDIHYEMRGEEMGDDTSM